MIIPDVNLAIYAHNAADSRYERAHAYWQSLLIGEEPVGLPSAVTTGFVRIVTGPKFEGVLTLEGALGIVAGWLTAPAVEQIEAGKDHFGIVSRLLIAAGIGHNLVPDAHLAALAIEHGATIHSHDRDFARWPELKLLDPLT